MNRNEKKNTTKVFTKKPLSDADQRKIRVKIAQEIRLFRWFQVAKGAGSIMPIINIRHLPIDLYLLRYRVGECAATHTDQTGHKTYRVNIILRFATIGGDFYGKTIANLGWLKIFRSDRDSHGVTPVTKGVRYVISFGLHR